MDMKKLKENVHDIQVGCETCKGAHLAKDCLLKEEVKRIEEAMLGETSRTHRGPGNGAKCRVGPQGYYTKI